MNEKTLLQKLLIMSKHALYCMILHSMAFTFVLANNGEAQNKRLEEIYISINLENSSLEDVLTEIGEKSDFMFVYNDHNVKKKREVTLLSGKKSLSEVLLKLSKDHGLKFKRVNKNIFVNRIKVHDQPIEDIQNVFADVEISGKITDENGKGLPGASVVEKSTANGTISDADGYYRLTLPEEGILVISFVGYVTQEISLGGRTTIDIQMTPDAEQLDEIVVTALGIEKDKSSLSYATQNLKNDEFNQARNGDLASQLQSRVPGLKISQLSTGGLVSSSRIILRGETSLNFNKNQPLIIVDGVAVSSNFDGVGASNRQDDIPTDFGNGFTGVNPDDIESVNVLKGATAAALYGSRAANGAIVITTKSGKGDNFSVVVNSGWTFETISRSWDFQNEYAAGLGGNYINGLGLSYGPKLDGSVSQPIMGSPISPTAEALLPYAQNTFVDDFFQNGASSNNSIAITSSNELGHIRVSYTHQNKKGIIPNTDFEKQAFSIKTGIKLYERLKLDVVSNYIKTGSDNLPVIGYGGQSIGYAALFWPRNASLGWVKDYWLPGQEYVRQNHVTFFTADNPWLIVNESLNGFDKNRIFGNTRLSYQINDNFSIFVRAGTDYYSDRRISRRPIGAAQFRNGMYREQNISFQESNFDFLGTYVKELSSSTLLDVSIGGNILVQDGNSLELESRDLAVPGVYNAGNIQDIPRLDEIVFEKQVNSLYGTAQLTLKNAIYLTASARNDWSSTLPSANNSYFYPSFGASFVLSELLELPSFFSQAKLRSTWAQVGSDTDPFLIQQSFAYGTLPGSVENQALIANTDLKPERTNSFEIGTELSFLDKRLGIELNFYKNVSKDQILQSPISTTSGFSSKLINAGEIKNQGIELLINATPLKIDDFRWDISLNYARNKSEVVKLADGIESFILVNGGISSGSFTIEARTGGEYGDLYGPVFSRNPQGEVIFSNGLPVLATDVGNLGNINPDWTGGMRNSFYYKGISLNVTMDYRSGGIVYSGSNSVMFVTGVNPESTVGREDGIIGDGVINNGDGTFRPNDVQVSGQTYHFDGFNGRRNAETNVFDATYFKLREASLSYDITKLLSAVNFIKKADLSVYGRNLIVWSKSDALRHFDPEIVTHNGGNTILPGVETAQLPGTRTFGFNVRLEF